jgi:hypothetical protein
VTAKGGPSVKRWGNSGIAAREEKYKVRIEAKDMNKLGDEHSQPETHPKLFD